MFAVEASNVADIANEVVHENNMQHIVQVFKQRVEDFELPDGLEEVDIIISEWMGFFLLHEGMLDSVISARDRFLSADGLMFPASATISLAACSVPSCFEEWNVVEGVCMKSVGRALNAMKSTKPEVMIVKPEQLLHQGNCLAWLDLRDVTLEEVNELTFKDVIVVERAGRFQGVCIWWECEFPIIDTVSVVLSTAPKNTPTHWKQTVVLLPEQSHENVDVRDPIAFSLCMRRSTQNNRFYQLHLDMLDQDVVEHPVPCDCILTKCILIKAHLERAQKNGPDNRGRVVRRPIADGGLPVEIIADRVHNGAAEVIPNGVIPNGHHRLDDDLMEG